MLRVMMLISVVATLLACGLVARSVDQAVQAAGEDLAFPLYSGDSLIEEKIIRHPVVVRATMTSFSSDPPFTADRFKVLKSSWSHMADVAA